MTALYLLKAIVELKHKWFAVTYDIEIQFVRYYEDRTSLSNIQQIFFLLKLRKYFSYQFIETMVLYANWFCKIFKLLLSSNLDNSSYHTNGSMPRCMDIS